MGGGNIEAWHGRREKVPRKLSVLPGHLTCCGLGWSSSKQGLILAGKQTGQDRRVVTGWPSSATGFRRILVGRCNAGKLPEIEGFDTELEKKLHPEVGDCRQELVFIGINMDELSSTKSLEACLLTDGEFSMGIEA